MNTSIKNEGFTLVELMVVVSIIGILSAVAIPNFKSYQAKAKTSEAKLQLASIYSAETALQSDYDSYGTCLIFAGFTLPVGNRHYYAAGYTLHSAAANALVANSAGNALCSAAAVGEVQGYVSGRQIGSAGVPVPLAGLSQVAPSVALGAAFGATATTFVASAAGIINTGADDVTLDLDIWAINQDKLLINLQSGVNVN